MDNNKFINQSFTLDELVIDELKDGARKKLIPLSHLVSKILTDYIHGGRYFE